MESSQRDELELVAHTRQFALEIGNRRIREVLPPVERRGTVVREHLARELSMHSVSEFLCFLQIGFRRLAPEEIGIWRVGDCARNGAFQPRSNTEKAFG